MISSGKKRGLAAVAVSALAVTGVPFIASPAQADLGDELKIASVSPALNGDGDGAVVILQAKGLADVADLRLAPAGSTVGADGVAVGSSFTTSNEQVTFVGATARAADSNPSDDFDEYVLRVQLRTGSAGQIAKFAVFEDDGATADKYDSSEAITEGQTTTAGEAASIEVSPAVQASAQGVESGKYTVTIRDAANRVTQLDTGSTVTIAPTSVANDGTDVTEIFTIDGAPIAPTAGDPIAAVTPEVYAASDAEKAGKGSFTFTAGSNVVGNHPISVASAQTGVADATAQLNVVQGVTLLKQHVDFVTDADTWDGFGNGSTGAFSSETFTVRVDQRSIKVDFAAGAANAGATVSVTATGLITGARNPEFGGEESKTFTTVLDASGKGTVTVTPDVGTVFEGSKIAFSGSGIDATAEFARSTGVSATTDASTYISPVGGSVDVKVTVVNGFGQPVEGAVVLAQRLGGSNADTQPSAPQFANADGEVTFTFTDTKATASASTPDNLQFYVFEDQYDSSYDKVNSGKIVYSADGQGADFSMLLDNVSPDGGSYNPASVTVTPLYDGRADTAAEVINVQVLGGTNGAGVTVSAEGALVLKGDDVTLDKAAASQSGKIGDANNFRIVGTKAGLATVTITSGGKTQTAQFTVKPTASATLARNIELTGPESAMAGDLVTFTATVTDAFGNPVAGVTPNVRVSGQGRMQDSSAASDADGKFEIGVRLDDDADSAVTVNVVGNGAQFGAAANESTAGAGVGTAPGLTASQSSASATITEVTNLGALQDAVDEAQAKVDNAQAAVNVAKGERKVAKTEKKVAKKQVKAAKKALKKAKKQKRGVKAARKDLREARGDNQIAKAKLQVARQKVKAANKRLADAKAELAAAEQALEDAQNNG